MSTKHLPMWLWVSTVINNCTGRIANNGGRVSSCRRTIPATKWKTKSSKIITYSTGISYNNTITYTCLLASNVNEWSIAVHETWRDDLSQMMFFNIRMTVVSSRSESRMCSPPKWRTSHSWRGEISRCGSFLKISTHWQTPCGGISGKRGWWSTSQSFLFLFGKYGRRRKTSWVAEIPIFIIVPRITFDTASRVPQTSSCVPNTTKNDIKWFDNMKTRTYGSGVTASKLSEKRWPPEKNVKNNDLSSRLSNCGGQC